MNIAHATPDKLAALRARVAAVTGRDVEHGVLGFGSDEIDGRLFGGGLTVGGLHEVACVSMRPTDDAAATLFIAGVAARFAAASDAPALWATTSFDLYAPGLEQAGLSASRLMFAEARDDKQLLCLIEDAVRDGSPAAVVGEVRRASMVETRRLQLAAADAGVPVLLYRRWRKANVDPLSVPTAAATRWRIGSALSAPLAVAGVGRPRWTVELARQRGGEPFSLIVEGCDETGRLAVPAVPARRAAQAVGAARHLAA